MNKKLQSLLSVLLLAVFFVTLLAGCSVKTVNVISYSAEDLGLVAKLIKAMHGWIGNFGWTVVVFTLFLKILMLPLDIWQRYSARKSSLKMAQMQPLLESIDKRYGANTQRANEEKQKLYQKEGFSAMSSCLPLIVTMIVFFVMFNGLRSYATYLNVQTFNTLADVYYESIVEKIDTGCSDKIITIKETWGTDEYPEGTQVRFGDIYTKPSTEKIEGEAYADLSVDEINKLKQQRITAIANYSKYAELYFEDEFNGQYLVDTKEQIATKYQEIKESWLWIQNVAQPDTWKKVMPEYVRNNANPTGYFDATIDMSQYQDAENTYGIISSAVNGSSLRNSEGKWNGLMLLPFLSIILSFASMWITQHLERKGDDGSQIKQDSQQQATNNTMMFIMPLMMAYFGFQYTGAFAIYMVANYLISILSTVLMKKPVDSMLKKNLAVDNNQKKASYMR